MDINAQYTLYLDWYRLNKNTLANKLRNSYDDFTKHDKKYLLRSSDFGGLIGFPLGIILLVNLYKWHSWQVFLFTPAIGLYLYWFVRHAVDLCCLHYFKRYEYPVIVERYVQSCLEQHLASLTPDANRAEIVERYRYYYRELVHHPFNWQKQGK